LIDTGEQHIFDELDAYGDIVLAEKTASAAKIGSILIPDMAQREAPAWRVLSVGPEQKFIKVGDQVMFSSGTKVEYQGRTIVALKPSEILARRKIKTQSDHTRY
jgi:co-chaperonin GroES (HSP10)